MEDGCKDPPFAPQSTRKNGHMLDYMLLLLLSSSDHVLTSRTCPDRTRRPFWTNGWAEAVSPETADGPRDWWRLVETALVHLGFEEHTCWIDMRDCPEGFHHGLSCGF